MNINNLSLEQTNPSVKASSDISVKLQEETQRAPAISDFDAIVTGFGEKRKATLQRDAALHPKSLESEKMSSKDENTELLPTPADIIKTIKDGVIRSIILNAPKPDIDSE